MKDFRFSLYILPYFKKCLKVYVNFYNKYIWYKVSNIAFLKKSHLKALGLTYKIMKKS